LVVDTQALLYLAACLLLPTAWGWLVHKIFVRLRLERYLPVPARAEPETPEPEELYYQI
jgi:hypothetical protein